MRKLIEERAQLPSQVFWISTLLSMAANLPGIHPVLKKAGTVEVRRVERVQGQKQNRFVAWTFLDARQQEAWRKPWTCTPRWTAG